MMAATAYRARTAARDQEREKLARTLAEASRIAARKAAEMERGRRRNGRGVVLGALLLGLGVVGTLFGIFSGLADFIGLGTTCGLGVGVVTLGAFVLLCAAEKPVVSPYAHNARNLDRLSRALIAPPSVRRAGR